MIAPDMATMLVLRLHRRADRRAGAAGAARRAASRTASTPSPSTATPRPPTRCCSSPPARPRARRAIDAPRDRRLGAFRAALDDLLPRSRAAGGARRRGGAQVRRGRGRPARPRRRSARRIALSIANSPLVKTAIAGEDANWGRVVMAVGKAGEPADRDRLAIWFGDIRVAVKGERDPAYSTRRRRRAYMKGERDRHPRRSRPRHAASDRSGPATSPRHTSTINGDYRS